MNKNSDIRERALDWMERVDQIGPFAPLTQLEGIYNEAPLDISMTPEYWYVSGLVQGRRGYVGLPGGNITAEEHLQILDYIAKSPANFGMEMSQQAAGLRDGYSIALGHYGHPRT